MPHSIFVDPDTVWLCQHPIIKLQTTPASSTSMRTHNDVQLIQREHLADGWSSLSVVSDTWRLGCAMSQVTAFVALLSWDARRAASGYADIAPCLQIYPSEDVGASIDTSPEMAHHDVTGAEAPGEPSVPGGYASWPMLQSACLQLATTLSAWAWVLLSCMIEPSHIHLVARQGYFMHGKTSLCKRASCAFVCSA